MSDQPPPAVRACGGGCFSSVLQCDRERGSVWQSEQGRNVPIVSATANVCLPAKFEGGFKLPEEFEPAACDERQRAVFAATMGQQTRGGTEHVFVALHMCALCGVRLVYWCHAHNTRSPATSRLRQ
jgi:hypothetical protein